MEEQQLNKKALYLGSAGAVTVGMLIIKGIAIVINKTIAIVLGV